MRPASVSSTVGGLASALQRTATAPSAAPNSGPARDSPSTDVRPRRDGGGRRAAAPQLNTVFSCTCATIAQVSRFPPSPWHTEGMGKRVPVALAVAFAALAGVLQWETLRLREPEPLVDGRPLTSWLDNNGSPEAERQASRAVEKAGTNAIPTLLRMLRQRDSAFKLKLIEWAQRQSFVKIHHTPAWVRNEGAFAAFMVLGARAESAVPALTEICEREISWPSQVGAVRSLAAIGPTAEAAVPVLLRATTNSHFLVRAESLNALARIQAKPEVAVPALTRALSDPNGTVRFVACNSLALLRTDAQQAVPVLVKSLRDPDREVQLATARALGLIDPEAAARAGVN